MISSKRINLIAILLIAAALIFTVYAMTLPNAAVSGNVTGTVEYSGQHSVTYSEDDYYSNYSENSLAKINLSGSTASSESKNVSIAGSEITILGGGTYVITGELTDGSIIVDSGDGAVVHLVLNGVSVTSEDFAAIYVKRAEKTIISTVHGTESYLADGSVYSGDKLEDGKPTAAIYSKDDLTINGGGTLIVTGNYKDGIKANDTLKITEGTLKVTAADDGINANDYIAVLGAEIEVTSGGDALKCENENTEKGFIAMEGTKLNVESEGDGVYASSAIYLNEVEAQIITGGGAADVQTQSRERNRPGEFGNQSTGSAASTKAVKAGSELVVNGGSFTLDSADDALHSNGNVRINGGKFVISCGDDALHADKNVTLEPETFEVSKCYEGIEGAYIEINGGDIYIISSDDGINAVGESASGGFGGMPAGMHKDNITAEDVYLTINAGTLRIETGGDGLDSNGAVTVNGRHIEIYGPEDSGNSPLDFEYAFNINGGSLLAAGSSGMAEFPAENSKQYSLIFYLGESYEAGSKIVLSDSGGNELMSGESSKKFDWICVSTAAITAGEKYTLTINGIEVHTIEATSVVTSSGSAGRRK